MGKKEAPLLRWISIGFNVSVLQEKLLVSDLKAWG